MIEAFRGTDQRLVVVGNGPERESLLAAAPPIVRIVSDVPDGELRWIYSHAKGPLAPSHENFGAPLEANARGLPVVALRRVATSTRSTTA
ncbi:glycosyltransferase [Ornithinimicrobium sp. W1665]|uniref:glycosyltransferase n=1 Tax=Ornithinimicrobium sp. W1665 TaxID=3416666 RepID=UPI003D6A91A1